MPVPEDRNTRSDPAMYRCSVQQKPTNTMKRILLALAAIGSAATLQAKITLPALFGDNMVLQQQTDARFWGKAAPGKRVRIRPSWSSKVITATADSAGCWEADVPTPAAGGPYTIDLSDGERLTLRDVLIGEVWLCSGQSNMEMPMQGFNSQPVEGSTEVIVRAKAATPIRICEVTRTTARTPQESCKAQWRKNTPEAVARTSATAYYFARCLQEVLEVPVGIIITCWGGTPVEAWMDRATLSAFKEFDLSFLDGDRPVNRPQNQPTMLYNAMIAPLAPYTVKGFLWYQGESNRLRSAQYQKLMPAFVGMLRERWGGDKLPFYYVQIAPYCYENPDLAGGSALLREAQMRNLEEIPASGMAVTMDIGDKGCIHPGKKAQVGQRLALLALANDYGMKGFEAHAPIYESMTVEGNRACLTFRTGTSSLAPLGRDLAGFEVAGADRVFHPATARIEQNKGRLIVTSDEVETPVAVRYAFRNYAEASLFNTCGIPAPSFRTDDWELPAR